MSTSSSEERLQRRVPPAPEPGQTPEIHLPSIHTECRDPYSSSPSEAERVPVHQAELDHGHLGPWHEPSEEPPPGVHPVVTEAAPDTSAWQPPQQAEHGTRHGRPTDGDGDGCHLRQQSSPQGWPTTRHQVAAPAESMTGEDSRPEARPAPREPGLHRRTRHATSWATRRHGPAVGECPIAGEEASASVPPPRSAEVPDLGEPEPQDLPVTPT